MQEGATNSTRTLLACGIGAGAIYVALGVLQILIRPGFDVTRHPLSILANGHLGWIQSVNFVLSGLLTMAGAVGLRRALAGKPAGAWGPRLLGVYGLGVLTAGFFRADPMNGFPIGTPEGPPIHPTLHSTLHIVSGSVGFLALIVSCFVFARGFTRLGQSGWAIFSAITGAVFFAAYASIASGSQATGVVQSVVTLLFYAAVVLAWIWISMLAARTRGALGRTAALG